VLMMMVGDVVVVSLLRYGSRSKRRRWR